jgi:RNA polymerase sigma-70 factor, ECF subfamily
MHQGGEPPWEDDDRLIVARIAAGDRCALETLYARHRQSLFGYCRALTSDWETAEEVLQDTLLAVWRGAGGYAGRSSVRGWLFGIARRQAHDARRRGCLPLADGEVLEMLPADDPGPEETALGRAGCAEIARAIGTLSPVHQEVLSLTFDQGLSYGELAEILGVPIGTVKSRLSLARRALRVALDGGGTTS